MGKEHVHFNVCLGNPPYQENDGGGSGNSAIPVYQKFVEEIIKMDPDSFCLVTPSRWMNGGRGLDKFREDMLNDQRIVSLTDYANSKELFPGVDIPGGVSYFVWKRDHQGDCTIKYKDLGKPINVLRRSLSEFPVYIRNNECIEIVRKVLNETDKTLGDKVSSQKPFGLRSFEKPDKTGELTFKTSKGTGPIKRSRVTAGENMIDKWKVIVSKVTTEHAGVPNKDGTMKVFAILQVLPPMSICSESYLVVDYFNNELEAKNLEKYLKTKFVRFLISQRLASMNMNKSSFSLVPYLDFSNSSNIDWNLSLKEIDTQLYEIYGLTQEERDLIESKIREME